MARNLVAAGHELVVLCRNERHHAAAAEVGARAVDRVDELAETDAVLSIVQDSPDVLGLALGENGLLARLRPGSLYDLSTIRPDAAREAGRAPLAWWSSRWAVKEFATTRRSKSNVNPSPAAASVTWAIIASTWSRDIPLRSTR